MFFGIVKIVGIILFLYLTWRNLHESYKDDLLVNFAWLGLLGMMVAGRVTFGVLNWGVWNDSWWNWVLIWQKPGSDLVGSIVGMAIATYWYVKVNNWKLWQFLEDILPIFLTMMIFFKIDELSIVGWDWKYISQIFILVAGVVIQNLLKNKYRSWSWYKSGKKGFNFFFITAFIFFGLSIISVIFKDNLTFIIVNPILGLISVVGLFMLGEVLSTK